MTESKFCEFCHTKIDDAKLLKAGSKGLRFCSRDHAAAYRNQQGDYARLAALGNKAQAEFKKIHGKAPGKRGGARPHTKQNQV